MTQTITEDELRRVVKAYSDMLLRVAMTRVPTPADAEDVVQDVFLRLLTHAPRFRDGEHEKAWLLRTTLNRSRDLYRLRRDDAPLEEATNAAVETPDYGPLHLYYYEGYSIKEIARLLALPVPTVGTRLARGRDRLREMLKEEELV